MIVIQLLLIVMLVIMMLRFLSSRRSSRTEAWKKLALLLLVVAAIIVVLFPDTSTRMANVVGVGRGADLLLYGLTIAFIFVQLNNYLKAKEEQRRVVVLARKVAIFEANARQKKQ